MKVLAFDPGATTGYAILEKTKRRGLYLAEAGAFAYGDGMPSSLKVFALLQQHAPSLVVAEDWENQGKLVNYHSIWPNRVIGQIEAYTALLGIHVAMVKASEWKCFFGTPAGLPPAPPLRMDEKREKIARHLIRELGAWPTAFAGIPADRVQHSIDAAGLAVYATLRWRRNGC